MRGLGARLKARSRDLGLADVEVARRAGLGEPRYAHYVADRHEPDLETLVRIANIFATTPHALLGLDPSAETENDHRHQQTKKLVAVAQALSLDDLDVLVAQAQAMGKIRFGKSS